MAAVSPPASPAGGIQRPLSALLKSQRSSGRMSVNSRNGGSKASDEDSKTAVKVAIRIRPPLHPSEPGFDLIPQRFRGSVCQVTSPTSLTVESAQGKKLFVFDRVFGEDVDQTGLWDYLSESVGSFIQGYNVSILAYGQSGAGKSYTMGTTGPREQADQNLMGVVPRAAMALFERLAGTSNHKMAGSGLKAPSRYSMQSLSVLNSTSKTNPDKNWQMKATYVEIYNEQLYDLLLPDSVPSHERPQVSIREDAKGRILLTGLRQVTINSVDDLLNALNFGSSIRQTDSTAVNAKSSRSHAVFSLNLIQKKSKTASTPSREKRFSVPLEAMSAGAESWVTVDSKLHFVDLAGSERLKNTGAHGERAREGISINAGLASLGKVIAQLSSRAAGSHVSYRDSRLTRLLQDSLGGSAITYMVACVNPAEFHLSETLNTVQYAQRARAIQSKPQIQQVSDEGDKQVVIDRLRAEVSFLRDQIRLSERTERRRNAPQERAERKQEREAELQNQLLDIQENYNALSQRHAKLISEITKSKDQDNEDPSSLRDTLGESAFDRLKRSNSFAEAVEQVVLEYEKTIQSLESSLSNTRSSLSTSESTLMEKETKMAYMETITQQLQARIHKAVDREANNESYLRDLEAKVEGVTNGEEKSASLIHDLRRELSRVRESEAGCEDYISTLEERLAEAEQDHETMQQEIDRLEHVIERQRSIGKLDSLLNDLDHMRQPNGQMVNHDDDDTTTDGRPRAKSSSSDSSDDEANSQPAHSHHETFFEADEELEPRAPSVQPIDGVKADNSNYLRPGALNITNGSEFATPQNKKATLDKEPSQSPAQSKFVADKLDSVTQELFDLRVEHESTLTDHEELKRKHQTALSTLAELQDSLEEARNTAVEPLSPASTRPTSFLGDAGVNGHKEDGQPSSSRTLSSELSLAGDSSENTESSDVDSVGAVRSDVTMQKKLLRKPSRLNREIGKLRQLNDDKDLNMSQLASDYTHLQEKHQDMLDYVEELKAEVQKAQLASSSSSPTQQVIRRKSSQVAFTVDRANRSAASLRNIALEHFEDEPDLFQNFDVNLSGLMTELHMRTERVQALEAELVAVRKEMETKTTIISGLTRERSSLKVGTPMDMSVISSMSDQLKESEKKIRSMQQDRLAKEKELTDQVQSLKVMLAARPIVTNRNAETSRDMDVAKSPELSPGTKKRSIAGSQDQQVPQLQRELSEWKTKHQYAMDAVKGSEDQLRATVRDMESKMKEADAAYAKELEAIHQKRATSSDSDSEGSSDSPEERIHVLEREIEEHKAASAVSKANVEKLENSYTSISKQLEDDKVAKSLTEKELLTHKDLINNLEGQLADHKAAIEYHQQSVRNLRASHAKEIQDLTNNTLRERDESEERFNAQSKELKVKITQLQRDLLQAQARHEDVSSTLHIQAEKAKADLAGFVGKISAAAGVASMAGAAASAENLASQIKKLNEERKPLLEKYERATATLQAEQEKVKKSEERAINLDHKVEELSTINDETLKELERIRDKERKSSRLVEELEEQLNSNFDQQQAANNRYSALQGERQVYLQEALRAKSDLEKALEESKAKVTLYESQLESQRFVKRDSLDPRDANYNRSDSAASNIRISTPQNSLPSPPPAIPLPPLPPGSPQPSQPAVNGVSAGATSPTTSRHQSKDGVQAQLIEDQEARIRTIEKHLYAEKQLTATLEEALTDVEASSTKTKSEMESWRNKCVEMEEQLDMMKKERNSNRYSLQTVEEERKGRREAESAKKRLEEQMLMLQGQKGGKKKKNALNCF